MRQANSLRANSTPLSRKNTSRSSNGVMGDMTVYGCDCDCIGKWVVCCAVWMHQEVMEILEMVKGGDMDLMYSIEVGVRWIASGGR